MKGLEEKITLKGDIKKSAKNKEKIQTLDEQERVLNENNLLIWNIKLPEIDAIEPKIPLFTWKIINPEKEVSCCSSKRSSGMPCVLQWISDLLVFIRGGFLFGFYLFLRTLFYPNWRPLFIVFMKSIVNNFPFLHVPGSH